MAKILNPLYRETLLLHNQKCGDIKERDDEPKGFIQFSTSEMVFRNGYCFLFWLVG